MKRVINIVLFLSFALRVFAGTDVPVERMRQVYEKVQTPYKYGLVLAPDRNDQKMDCPTVFREGKRWYMSYLVYNGKGARDGRGYETWLATSDDLLHWKTLGRILSYKNSGWDKDQRGGYISLIDTRWGGSYQARAFNGKHWLTYIGGDVTGYEMGVLKVGVASTAGKITEAHEWKTLPDPVLSPEDPDNGWWESLTQYKSNVIWDKSRKLGEPFVMFYNAGGVNPTTQLKGERIGIALSNDMQHWKRYTGSPVINHEGGITGDAVIQQMDDLYVLFYFSAFRPGSPYKSFNNFACSYDLVHWTDWAGEPLIVPSAKGCDDLFAHKSCVVKHQGVVYHFYCAVDKENQRGIAVATSKDLGISRLRFPNPEETTFRKELSLSGPWESRLESSNDQKWMPVIVPHNWDQYDGDRRLRHGNLHGTAWYRKTFVAPEYTGKRVFLYFEGVGSYATVFLNGDSVGFHRGGRTTFTLDVTASLKSGVSNELLVKAEHPAYITDLPWVCGGCSNEMGFSEGSQPLGVFRPVTLLVTDEVRVQPFGVHLWNEAGSIRKDGATLQVETTVKNYGTQVRKVEVVNKLVGEFDIQVARATHLVLLQPGEERVIKTACELAQSPKRWSVETPNLYTMVTMIKENGKVIDEDRTSYGFRTVSWPQTRNDGDRRFRLNDQSILINGVCEYEHLNGMSHAFSEEQVLARTEQIRAAGFNAFREGHQPHNLRYGQIWDKTGMLQWSQFSAHIWYDTPAFRENFKTLLKEWIVERRNSPSVILWGLQNESSLPVDFARECCDLIRRLDPTASTERLITTCNGGEGTDWNVIQNWSGTYGGHPEKYGEELKTQLLNGEYGAWRTIDLHTEGNFVANGIWSEDRANLLLEQKIRLAEANKDSLCGQFLWLFASHENPGRHQNEEGFREIDRLGPFNNKGLFTSWGEPTDAYYLYQSNYAKEPMVYIVSHTWPDRWINPGVKDSLLVFSNCDSVELFNDVNAASLGMKVNPGRGRHFQWDQVNIRYNLLYAVGYKQGKPVVNDCIVLHHLPEAPHRKALPALSRAQIGLKSVSTKGAKGYDYLYRYNCGGAEYRDVNGQVWSADEVCHSGTPVASAGSLSWAQVFDGLPPMLGSQRYTNDPIAGTTDDALFQSFRYGTNRLRFRFPVRPGTYRVELYFTEPWYGAGSNLSAEGWRQFDVAVNGMVICKDLDLWREVGHDGAYKYVSDVVVTGDSIDVFFPRVAAGQAVISAIAIAAKSGVEKVKTGSVESMTSLSSNKEVSLQTWLNTGCSVYEKGTLSFSALPPILYAAEWIRKNQETTTGNAHFTVDVPALLYVGMFQEDSLGDSYEKCPEQATLSDGRTLCFYKCMLPAVTKDFILPLDRLAFAALVPVVTPIPEPDPRPDVRLEAENAKLDGTVFEKGTFKDKDGICVTKVGKAVVEWTMNPGLAGVYNLRFRYRNTTEKTLPIRLQILSSDNRVLRDDVLSFPPFSEKWRVISTTTEAYINAGAYRVRLISDDAAGLWLDSMDVQ
jgi:beta-galactosidase